jgi:hypothetical protein
MRLAMTPELKTYSDGTRAWFLNGQLHRTDGPAMELTNGTRKWCLNGKLHRPDGPAIEWANGTREWYLNGKKCTGKLHRALTQGPAENLLLLLGQGWDEFIEQRLKSRT